MNNSENLQYEVVQKPFDSGIRVSYLTVPGGYHPMHWHEELEILFHLNGESDITVEGKKYQLKKKQLLVVESRKIHSTYTYEKTAMQICIQISREYMKRYLPAIDLYQIECIPDEIPDEKFPAYLELCEMLSEVTRLYMRSPLAFEMETEGLILQLLARLLRDFSVSSLPETGRIDSGAAGRIRTAIDFVEKNYPGAITLQDAANELGLGKEYFCRFFKKYMGMTFMKYLNEVRVTHIYQELETTDEPIAELAEKNGFTNQKLFNKVFKEIYGCVPSAVRKSRREEQA